MPKPKVEAKSVLDDIKAGLEDAALMEKYNLSVKGLHSVLEKLVSVGALDESFIWLGRAPHEAASAANRELSAKEVLKDIKAGATDSVLMRKYKLSAKGLQNLFEQLLDAGLVKQSDLEMGKPPMESTVELTTDMLPPWGLDPPATDPGPARPTAPAAGPSAEKPAKPSTGRPKPLQEVRVEEGPAEDSFPSTVPITVIATGTVEESRPVVDLFANVPLEESQVDAWEDIKPIPGLVTDRFTETIPLAKAMEVKSDDATIFLETLSEAPAPAEQAPPAPDEGVRDAAAKATPAAEPASPEKAAIADERPKAAPPAPAEPVEPPAAVDSPAEPEDTTEKLEWRCPACMRAQSKAHEVCPECGVNVSKFLELQRPPQDPPAERDKTVRVHPPASAATVVLEKAVVSEPAPPPEPPKPPPLRERARSKPRRPASRQQLQAPEIAPAPQAGSSGTVFALKAVALIQLILTLVFAAVLAFVNGREGLTATVILPAILTPLTLSVSLCVLLLGLARMLRLIADVSEANARTHRLLARILDRIPGERD